MRRVFVLLFGFLACNGSEESRTHASVTPSPDVLATAGSRVISDDDVTAAMLEHYDSVSSLPVNERKQKVLDVLVQTATLASAREQELSASERADLDLRVAAYREKLLIERYLVVHNTTPGVTAAQVHAYYAAHPEKFGARVEKGYQLLSSTRPVAAGERASVEQALAEARGADDWAAWIGAHASLPIGLRSGPSITALHPRLRQALDELAVGKTSEVIAVQGIVMLARVTRASTTSPRPLSEVEPDIRRMLAPAQMSTWSLSLVVA